MIEENTGIQECPGFLYRDLELISRLLGFCFFI
jgi:hypothetical protein